MPHNPDPGEDLQAQTLRVQTDFVSADLEMALTFTDMARLELELGEAERAQGLISKARRASDLVADHLHRTRPPERDKLTAKLAKLLDAIREAEAGLHNL